MPRHWQSEDVCVREIRSALHIYFYFRTASGVQTVLRYGGLMPCDVDAGSCANTVAPMGRSDREGG